MAVEMIQTLLRRVPWSQGRLQRTPGATPREDEAKAAVLSFPWRRLVLGLAVVAVAGVLAAGLGSVSIPPLTVARILASKIPGLGVTFDGPASFDTILMQLRLPRIVLAAIVGGSLALSGAAYQGLFRNPLADPYLIGVASGAGLGATIVLVAGVQAAYLGVSLLPAAAFVGAIAAVSVAFLVARSSVGLPLTTLILAGVAISFITSAMTTLLMIRSDPDLRPILSWLLGGLISAQWKHSVMVLPYLLPSAVIVLMYSRVLNVMQLREEHAKQLGVNVGRAKLLLIVAASLATAAAVAFTGPIGFVGLIAPHTVRLLWGADYRSLLPMAAILGAAFLILADLVARTVVSPSELPVGVVTAFFGGPFFLFLLRYRRRVVM
jgi:iron complex transport system permease protein